MDANATTPLLPEVMEAMRPYWMEHFGNASSIHLHGQQAHAAVDRARTTMADFLNCHAAEVVFNSGGATAGRQGRRDNLLCAPAERADRPGRNSTRDAPRDPADQHDAG